MYALKEQVNNGGWGIASLVITNLSYGPLLLGYSSLDAAPGPSSNDTGQQGVELPCIQLKAVLLNASFVPFDQGLPQPAVCDSELVGQFLGRIKKLQFVYHKVLSGWMTKKETDYLQCRGRDQATQSPPFLSCSS